MKSLPVLEQVRIATPCSADWDEMSGDAKVRFCGKCEKNVYNLSQMTRTEAEELVREREGRLCVRFYQRPDGTMLTADCPVGVRRMRLRQRVWASLSGAAASLMLLLGAVSARADLTLKDGGKKKPGIERPHVTMPMMGAVAYVDPSPAPQAHKPPPSPPQVIQTPPERRPMMGEMVVAPPPKKK